MFGQMGHKMTMKEARDLWGLNAKKLENNTFEFTSSLGQRNITLHRTIIITELVDGRYMFNTDGHRSNTTMDRLRKYSPKEVSFYSVSGNWFITGAVDGETHTATFRDDIVWPDDVVRVPTLASLGEGDLKSFINTQCEMIARNYGEHGAFTYSFDRPPGGSLALARAIKAKGRYPKPIQGADADSLIAALKAGRVPPYVEAMLMARYGDNWAAAERPGRHYEGKRVRRRLKNIINHLLLK